jgi:hypothetical protein
MYTSTTYDSNHGYTRTTTTRSPVRTYTTTRSPARVHTSTYVAPLASTYVTRGYSPVRTYTTTVDPVLESSRVVTTNYSPVRTYATTLNHTYSPSRVVTTTLNGGYSPARVVTTTLDDGYSPSRTYTTSLVDPVLAGSRVVTTNYSPSRTYTTNYGAGLGHSRVTTSYDGYGGYTKTVANDHTLNTIVEDPLLRITSSPLGKSVRTTTVNNFGLGVTRTTDFVHEPVVHVPESTTHTTVNHLGGSRIDTTTSGFGNTIVSERRGSPVRSYSTTVYDDQGAPRTYTTTFEDALPPVTTSTTTTNYGVGLGLGRSTIVRETSPGRSI